MFYCLANFSILLRAFAKPDEDGRWFNSPWPTRKKPGRISGAELKFTNPR
jgi:hypothetical protein